MKTLLILLFSFYNFYSFANCSTKKSPSKNELAFIQTLLNEMSYDDQLYREIIAVGTFDAQTIHEIDSVYDNFGTSAGIEYEQSLNLKLTASQEDSLWKLQHQLDFKNHQLLRGIIDRYGWISKEMVADNNYIQLILLLHPPKDWDTNNYLKEYSALLLTEVNANRMPAKKYALFYDNIKVKILKQPQLYGTNEMFDSKTRTILPPAIINLNVTNEARAEIGLSPLKEGEYRLILLE